MWLRPTILFFLDKGSESPAGRSGFAVALHAGVVAGLWIRQWRPHETFKPHAVGDLETAR